jgi:hypothetical protein
MVIYRSDKINIWLHVNTLVVTIFDGNLNEKNNILSLVLFRPSLLKSYLFGCIVV